MKATVKGREINNQWIVPYNPYLSLKFNCHINVEICSSTRSVKYLFKYVYKGHDCANVAVTESKESSIRDEPKEYVDCRYVSAPEAIWRIFKFKMHDQSHAIYRLHVHLENEQTVCFMEGNEEVAVDRAKSRDSKLTAWFALNKVDVNARELKYWEIPTHYTWDNKNTRWKKRLRGGDKVIGRMYTVSVKEQERYYLRLLLSHAQGATSFEDLRTVENGDEKIVFATFREAAKEKGFLLDDTVWQETLDDAKMYAMPYQLRQLYAYICALGNPSDKAKLWNDNKKHLVEDFCHKFHQPNKDCDERCESYALKDLKETLELLNYSLKKCGLREPPKNLQDLTELSFDPYDELLVAEDMKLTLNSDQRSAFETIIDATKDQSLRSKLFFLDGPGGSGKTYLYTTLLRWFRGNNELCLPSASTGIAANLLIGGRTYHSLFGLPVPVLNDSKSKLGMKTADAKNIKRAKLLIIDECTMASCHV